MQKKHGLLGEKIFHWSLLFIIFLGVLARIWQFGHFPLGLNQDEASMGYDLYANWFYGVDRNGFHNPLFFVAWGSGMQAFPYYFLILPSILVFGLNAFALRFPVLVLNLFALFAFYIFLRRTTDKEISLLAVAFLAMAPWNIMSARWCLEPHFSVSTFVIGMAFLTAKNPRYFLLSSVLFAVSTYCYAPAVFFVPIFLVSVLTALWYFRIINWRTCVLSGLFYGLLILPIAVFFVINHWRLPSMENALFSIPALSGTPRFETITSLFSAQFFSHFKENFFSFLSLMQKGNDGLIWNALPSVGFQYFWSWPFIFLGVALCIKEFHAQKKTFQSVFLLWALAGALLAGVMDVNLNRIMIFFPPLAFFTALGVRFFRFNKPLMYVIVGGFFIAFLLFCRTYFTSYQKDIGYAFFNSFDRALQYATTHTDGKICVTDSVNAPYIFVLFFEREDPRGFIRSVEYANPGAEFQAVRSFGRFFFGLNSCPPDTSVYVVEKWKSDEYRQQEIFRIEDFENYSVALRK